MTKKLFGTVLLAVAFCAAFVPIPVFAGSPGGYADLAEQVIIRRTDFGVPHILAETEKAAAFGFAWCQAEDHLPILMKAFVRARGETAKYFDERNAAEADLLVHLFRARERAIENFHRHDQDYRDVLAGFAAGVNFYLQQHPEKREPWMDEITPYDVAAAGQVAGMRFSFNRGGVIQRFLARQARGGAQPAQDVEDTGSNQWAFAPERTASGNTILLNNPHQPWSEQANYYEAHITVPGVYNFYGSTFVGGPILTTGFNAYLGWSHTVNYPDLEEIYEIALDPERPDHILFDGSSAPMWSEQVSVEVMNGDPVERTHWYTHLGPVIHRTADKVYVLRSVSFDLFRGGEQWYAMSKARSLDEFRAIQDMQSIAMFNIAYADRDKNIYYLWNGTIPVIPHENHFDVAQPASNSSEIWTRIHAVDELPQLLNPVGGYVQNCNDPPWYTSLKALIDRAGYPAYFPNPRLTLRTQHSLRLIDNDDKYTLEDVVRMKHSPRALLAGRVKEDLIQAVEAASPSQDEKKALDILRAWDNTVAADSVGGVILKVWWETYARQNPNPYATPWTPEAAMSTPRGIGDTERAVRDFRTAVAEVQKRFGRLDVAWGEAHRLRRGDLDVPVSGGESGLGCFRILGFRDDDDGKWVARTGDSYVFAVEFTPAGPVAYSVLAYSQSSNPESPHYNDQSVLFARNEMKPVRFLETDIHHNTIAKYHPGQRE